MEIRLRGSGKIQILPKTRTDHSEHYSAGSTIYNYRAYNYSPISRLVTDNSVTFCTRVSRADYGDDRVAALRTRDGFTQHDPQNIFYLPSVHADVLKTRLSSDLFQLSRSSENEQKVNKRNSRDVFMDTALFQNVSFA